MEVMTTFTLAIVIVFGILQIILFFKLWGMTNDIKELKFELLRRNMEKEANVFFLTGDKQAAYNKLNDNLLKEIVAATNWPCSANTEYDYKVRYLDIIAKYKPAFEKIALGHPDYSLYDELDKVKL